MENGGKGNELTVDVLWPVSRCVDDTSYVVVAVGSASLEILTNELVPLQSAEPYNR